MSKSVNFSDATGDSGKTANVPKDGQLSDSAFMEAFSEHVARRDYTGALTICRKRLKQKPDDRIAVELKKEVERFKDAADELDEGDDGDEELLDQPDSLEELQDKASVASFRGFEALFAYFQDDQERLWSVGEQAVGIFWDVGQISPAGPLQNRLRDMARANVDCLTARLKAVDRKVSPAGCFPTASAAAELGCCEWLIEGLGQVWFRRELGLVVEPWLLEGCRKEWVHYKGNMETLTGFSIDGLHKAEMSELCDILMQTWTLERSIVCGILDEGKDKANLPALDYGIAAVLKEIRSRPLVEAPLPGFIGCFYNLTHVVYTLNCFNGHLPNRRADCPWLYSYLERCLDFWLREVQHFQHQQKVFAASASPDVIDMMGQTWIADAVDAVAETVDCLQGLGPEGETDAVRQGAAWLLSRQEADGLFYSPSVKRPADSEYDHVHPTWVALAALQFKRVAPGPSSLCAVWAEHCKLALKQVDFAQPPPPRSVEPASTPPPSV